MHRNGSRLLKIFYYFCLNKQRKLVKFNIFCVTQDRHLQTMKNTKHSDFHFMLFRLKESWIKNMRLKDSISMSYSIQLITYGITKNFD